MKCQACKTEIQSKQRFCSNCGTLIDIQQQRESILPTVMTSPNQLGQQTKEEKKRNDSSPANPSALPSPEGEQSRAPQTPVIGIVGISPSEAPQMPGMGIGGVSSPAPFQQSASGVGEISQHGAHQQPYLGSSGYLQHGAHQQPASGASGYLQHGAHQQPASGASGFPQHGAHQQPSLGTGQATHTYQPVHAPQHSSGITSVGNVARPAAKTAGKTARAIAGRVINTIITVAVLASAGVGLYTFANNNHILPKNPFVTNTAPADNANFQVNISIQGQYDGGHGPFSNTITLIAKGGSICSPLDTGQLQTIPGPVTNSQPTTENAKLSCTGTYKGGHITYTETLTSAVISGTDQGSPYTCTLLTPGQSQQLTGSYNTDQGNFSGTITVYAFPTSAFSCPSGVSYEIIAGSGAWTGTITS